MNLWNKVKPFSKTLVFNTSEMTIDSSLSKRQSVATISIKETLSSSTDYRSWSLKYLRVCISSDYVIIKILANYLKNFIIQNVH